MTRISRDNPFFYLTSVTNDRLPVFRTDKFKQILADSFDEARRSAGFMIFAYVIMPDHYHLITDSRRSSSEVLRFINGISARRVIDHLKSNGPQSSLAKLRRATKKNEYKYSLWEHHPNCFGINNEETLRQKVGYIHQNPVRAGLTESADDYLFSSSRIWNGRPLENEPLLMDNNRIEWRREF